MAAFLLKFEWDPVKARANFTKHGVDFERAAEVFRDPLALTISDDEHSHIETRWITMGKDTRGQSMVVVHTYDEIDSEIGRIRIISARRPTRAEMRDYKEQR